METLSQIVLYERKENSAIVRRCFSYDGEAVIPGRIGDLEVTELAPYCFSEKLQEKELSERILAGTLEAVWPLGALESREYEKAWETIRQSVKSGKQVSFQSFGGLPALCGERLESLIISETVQKAGRYCFYNCSHLHTLEFGGKLTDWGNGVFNGCHKIRAITIRLKEEEKTMLKEVLDEVGEPLELRYVVEKQGREPEEARLIFPEFYEEGVENTPARILETHVHGSGMRYRNCFQNRKFDFHQYDLLFLHAKAQESPEIVTKLALGRLQYPYELGAGAREEYEAYVREHKTAVGKMLIEQKELGQLCWLCDLVGMEEREWKEELVACALACDFSEAVSELMNRGRKKAEHRRRRMEL